MLSVEREIQVLKAVTQSELLAFFDKYIGGNSPHRRKLSVQVWGATHPLVDATNEDASTVNNKEKNTVATTIKDVIDFKRSLFLYPVPVPGKY